MYNPLAIFIDNKGKSTMTRKRHTTWQYGNMAKVKIKNSKINLYYNNLYIYYNIYIN